MPIARPTRDRCSRASAQTLQRLDDSRADRVSLARALVRLLNAHQRFRPITLERPKALLPLANVPMIEYVLEFLASNGVRYRLGNL